MEVQNTPLHLSELVASFQTSPQQQGTMHCLTQLTEHAQYLHRNLNMPKLDVASLFTTHLMVGGPLCDLCLSSV